MFWYPFDTQECTMEFTLEEVSSMFVELIPGDMFYNEIKENKLDQFYHQSLNYTGEAELDLYYIKAITLLPDQTTVKITFGRGLFTILLTIYLTTILVNFVGHSSVFYKNVYFEAQVSLNVTVMLVQVTMFTSVSINTPCSKQTFVQTGLRLNSIKSSWTV